MADASKYPEKLLHSMLSSMVLIRRFEEATAQAYGLRKIGGFCHLYNGQEAVAVGAVAGSDLKKDYHLTSYRDHAHALACGMDPKAAMAEMFGKITGCSKGKGGSMHLFDVERHMLGGNGIVGAQIPMAAGAAFASAYRKDGGVALCYFGDGAIHQGAFHETMNLAALWKLPLILIVENNQYGMGTSVARASSVEDFAIKAKGYGLTGTKVDGMCVLTVYDAIKKALAAARKGEAQLMDIKTYRYRGHSMSDPARYRTKDDLEKYKKQDPILQLRADMEKAGYLDEKTFLALDKRIKAQVAEAVKFSEESAEPSLEEMYTDVVV